MSVRWWQATMNNEYAARYRDLYERHWWWRARERAILELLDQCLPAIGRARILDVGCGDGLLFDRLAQYGQVDGVEVNGALVSPTNRWRERIHIGPFDAEYRPDYRYDVILMLDVLEHLPDPLAALRHAATLLEDHGLLVIHVPAFMALWTTHDELNHHFTRYTQATLRDLIRRTDLRVQTCHYTFHWTFPAKLAIRVKETLFPGGTRPPRVPRRLVNTMAYAVCLLEQRLARHLRPTFGSSLLVVVRPTPRRAANQDHDLAAGVAEQPVAAPFPTTDWAPGTAPHGGCDPISCHVAAPR